MTPSADLPSDLGAYQNMKWMADQRDTTMKCMLMLPSLSLHQLQAM
jgi:hypothetical protein